MRVTVRLLLIGLAFASGVAVQTSYPTMGRQCFPALDRSAAAPAPAARLVGGDSPRRDDEERVDQLLSQVGAHARRLSEQKAALQRQDKEQRIAYQILRTRGQSADTAECMRLVERHKLLAISLDECDAALAEAERLESKLHELVDSRGVPPEEMTLDAQLRAEIRRSLNRHPTADKLSPTIPNEQWQGGPDKLMYQDAACSHGQDR
jgi:hypothetical protein